MIAALIRWSIQNRFLVVMGSLGIAGAGVWALLTIPVDAMPDLSDVQVIIVTDWDGQNPQIVEDQVTYPISTAMLSVPGVQDVRAKSFFGVSFINVIFEDGTDMYWARSRVLEYLTEVSPTLPSTARMRLGPDATGLGWVYMYTLEDPTGTLDLGELRALHDWQISFQLRAVDGVAEIAVVGGAPRRYEILVDPVALYGLGLTVPDVAEAVRLSNEELGGNIVEFTEGEFMVRGRGYLRSVKDIEDIELKTSKHRVFARIKDVATVTIGPDVVRGIADRDGRGEVVAGIVVMRQGGNARKVIAGIKEAIEQRVKPSLPPGTVIRTAYDRSALIERSISTLTHALALELVVLAAIILIFLVHVRSASVAFIVLPLGALISLLVMKLIGVNANIMSLAGIAIAFGTMVDASIVLVENVHKHLERGDKQDRLSLVTRACQEVGPGLFFSLMVVAIGFLPIFALEDQAGRLFRPLAFTKTFAMGAACLLSVTLIPALVWYFVRGKIVTEKQNPFAQLLILPYAPVVRFATRFPYVTIAGALILVAATVGPLLRLGSEFMPPLEEGDLLYMPTSTPGLGVTEARRVLQTQDALLKQFPEVRSVLGKIGRSSSATDPAPLEMVETTVRLHDESDWPERAVEPGWFEERAIDSGLSPDQARSLEQSARPELDDRIRLTLARDAAVSDEDLAMPVQRRVLEAIRPQVAVWADEIFERFAGRPPAEPTRSVPLRRLTFDELTQQDMKRAIQIAGMPNWFLMPIQTRVGMITTGMRGELGLKVYGTDYGQTEAFAIALEQLLKKEVPHTLSAVADRVATRGTYLDIQIDRGACARYGLKVHDVQKIVATAIGGMPVTTTVEGRFRFPVVVRYPRELRDDPERLMRIMIPLGTKKMKEPGVSVALTAPTPNVITLGQVVDIEIVPGPMAIKSERNRLVIYLPIAFEKNKTSIGEYVAAAEAVLSKAVEEGRLVVPPGTEYEWSGMFEIMERTNRRLSIVVPLALVLVFLVLYVYFRRLAPTLVVIISTILFAPIGGVWLMWALDYNVSTASWVGFIAVMGLAAETAVIMFIYLDNAYRDRLEEHGRMTPRLLDEAIQEGATMRVRPKMMTVLTDFFGVLPLLFVTGAGAATLQRMAAPLVGGVLSSMVLTLVVIPAAYKILYGWRLKSGTTSP